jgi:hypothetical protein
MVGYAYPKGEFPNCQDLCLNKLGKIVGNNGAYCRIDWTGNGRHALWKDVRKQLWLLWFTTLDSEDMT